jgi:hypothetical protein
MLAMMAIEMRTLDARPYKCGCRLPASHFYLASIESLRLLLPQGPFSLRSLLELGYCTKKWFGDARVLLFPTAFAF